MRSMNSGLHHVYSDCRYGCAAVSGDFLADSQQPAAPAPVNWPALISDAMASRKTTIRAHTFVHLYQDDSKPVELICDDGQKYVVKSLWADLANRPADAEIKIPRTDQEQGRRMFNDQTCGRLGAMMGAPVPTVALIEVPADLIQANPRKMGHLKPCIGHGSRRIDDVSGKVGGFRHADKGDNRARYNCLSVFYGWLVCGDMQFIRGNQPPHSIYSHDHGHFFPGGPMWTQASLAGYHAPPVPTQQIVTDLKLSAAETTDAIQKLAAVTVANIAEAIGASGDDWKVSIADRSALAAFIHDRQTLLKQTLKSLSPGAAQ